jgi:predicted lipoprotein with Yx(FWY)xxD motif
MYLSKRRRITIVFAALIAGGAIASMAFAKTTTTLQTAHNSKLAETIVISASGRTLYALRPETAHHLLCKNSQCFMFWPPLKVSKNAKLTAAKGIKGKLGKLHRNGFYQVTLGGDPLYMFAEDSGKGQANGNGIKSFGGTWHVIATSAAKQDTPTTTTTTTTQSTTSTYSYPVY